MQNTNKNKILKLYYEKHEKRTDISIKLNISTAYITRIIKQDFRYESEKLYRKEISKQKQTERTKEYITRKREFTRNGQVEDFLRIQHNRDVYKLSYRRNISNVAIRKWCSGAYHYNSRKKRFEFDEKIGRSYAMPKAINY